MRYRKVVARYPQSRLLRQRAARRRLLYREMAERFQAPALRRRRARGLPHAGDGVPSSSRWATTRSGPRSRWPARAATAASVVETARAYLETYPEGERAARGQGAAARARAREPAAQDAAAGPRAASSTCAPGAASRRRAWSIYLERKVQIQYDRIVRARPALGGPRRHPAPPEPRPAARSPSATACSSRCASRRTGTTSCASCSTSRTSRTTRSSTWTTRSGS